MNATIIKIDKYDATVEFKPDWLERLFGIKAGMEQFQRSTMAYRSTCEAVWCSYKNGEDVPNDSSLHKKLTRAYKVYTMGKAPL